MRKLKKKKTKIKYPFKIEKEEELKKRVEKIMKKKQKLEIQFQASNKRVSIQTLYPNSTDQSYGFYESATKTIKTTVSGSYTLYCLFIENDHMVSLYGFYTFVPGSLKTLPFSNSFYPGFSHPYLA